jgi:hypothetical protein
MNLKIAKMSWFLVDWYALHTWKNAICASSFVIDLSSQDLTAYHLCEAFSLVANNFLYFSLCFIFFLKPSDGRKIGVFVLHRLMLDKDFKSIAGWSLTRPWTSSMAEFGRYHKNTLEVGWCPISRPAVSPLTSEDFKENVALCLTLWGQTLAGNPANLDSPERIVK